MVPFKNPLDTFRVVERLAGQQNRPIPPNLNRLPLAERPPQ